jgi:pimeloyl-ACP methyl ester carboxylesterase
VALTAAQLEQVDRPVRLVWGSEDAFGGPDVGVRVARALPDAELEVVSGAGHVPWIGHPDEVAGAALPFLRTHASSTAER